MCTSRRLAVLALVLVVAVASGCSDDDDGGDDAAGTTTSTTAVPSEGVADPEASNDGVVMSGTAFVPGVLTVPVGSEVTWTNEDGVTHTTTAEDGAWDSGQLDQGGTFAHDFDEVSSFAYICQIHSSMQGEIVVTEA